jgi:phosphocarrier protein HPr
MAELHLTVLDPGGLHARPAAQVVRTAGSFQSRISIHVGDRTADVKSLIAVLGLTIRPGAQITLAADGPDDAAALAALLAELGPAVQPSQSDAEQT